MKKIKASLQKMHYEFPYEDPYDAICLVDNTTRGGEFTLCGNAIPDSTMEYDGFCAIGEEFLGSVKDITCPNCLKKLNI